MDLPTELQLLLVAAISALIPVVPIAVVLLKTYLQVQQNRLELDHKPTHDEVSLAIDSKLKELIINGGAERRKDRPGS